MSKTKNHVSVEDVWYICEVEEYVGCHPVSVWEDYDMMLKELERLNNTPTVWKDYDTNKIVRHYKKYEYNSIRLYKRT